MCNPHGKLTRIMGHNYLKNDANVKKTVTTEEYLELAFGWRKPHCSKFSRLEMASKTKLVFQEENGENNTSHIFKRTVY